MTEVKPAGDLGKVVAQEEAKAARPPAVVNEPSLMMGRWKQWLLQLRKDELDRQEAAAAVAREVEEAARVPHPASAMSLKLTCLSTATADDGDRLTLATVTPPQTRDAAVAPTPGAHCLVLDISGSMGCDATVTTDDGDKVSHGWSQLDIVKHAACTYIRSLGPSDFLCVVTYSTSARHEVTWRACSDEGKEELDAAVRSLHTEGSTNMKDGIELGFQSFLNLPTAVATSPSEYAMMLVVCTDGMPDNRRYDYQGQVRSLKHRVEELHCPSAVPALTSIGFGNALDSSLLRSFADVFLHIPDPGSVGPFVVNLVASTRCTAKLSAPSVGNLTANRAMLVVEPAAHVSWVPTGFPATTWHNGSAVAIDMGSIAYDQPRHVLLKTSGDVRATVVISGHEIAHSQIEGSGADFAAHVERIAVISALETSPVPVEALKMFAEHIAPGPLRQTIATEVLLALEPSKFELWGRHYINTLPTMLRLERRSNFRDACLQEYGKDMVGRDGLFEQLCSDAEMVFSTITPPEPSNLRSRSNSGIGSGGGSTTTSMMNHLPEEFMRGGGCFGPHCTVKARDGNGVEQRRACDIAKGDWVAVVGGGFAQVACVVLSPCAEGHARLCRIGNLLITPWHPVHLRGGWHFPAVCGMPVELNTAYVYNFVLESSHVLLVEGLPCVTLGHGLVAPIAAHPFWGTGAVLDVLRTQNGWEDGRVVLSEPLRSGDVSVV